MKLRQYLLIIISVVLLVKLTPDPRILMSRNPLEPLIAHAQQQGFTMQSFVHVSRLTADFTDANASGAQNINGLAMAFPANFANNYWFQCQLGVTQATNVADNIGISPSNPPNTALTQVTAYANWSTGGAAVVIGAPTRFTATGNTNVVSFTPSVATELQINIWGSFEVPSIGGDTIAQMTVTQGTAADVIVVKRGATCIWIGSQ